MSGYASSQRPRQAILGQLPRIYRADGSPIRVLLVDDEPALTNLVKMALHYEGWVVDIAHNGREAIAKFASVSPDVLVLDIMLPGLSGYDVCKQLRTKKISIPILMLTAKSQELDKVVGLDLGADDYVTKPFGVRELLARIHALLRRAETTVPKNEEPQSPFRIGAATIDPKTFQVTRGAVIEELTARELKLLQFLHAHPGEVLSRDRLLNEVWGYNYYGTTRTLDQVIVQIRKKLGDSGEQPKHLVTVHGVGYKLVLSPKNIEY